MHSRPTLGVLLDSAKDAFQPNVMTNDLIRLASHTSNGDVRIGLKILKKAGRKAEIRHANDVSEYNLEEAITEARLPLIQRDTDLN
jgi:Cdc6-like AAA superfamily ATPase